MQEQSSPSGMASESSYNQPVWLLRRNPLEWREASLPKLQEVFHETKAVLSQEERTAIQENRWTERTGLLPQDSSFTLIVPIHNEERSLSSFLGTLMLSDLPKQVKANILFITNACQDKSGQMVEEFLKTVGQTEQVVLSDSINDVGINSLGTSVKAGNIRFAHLDTQTRGKANALNIGNQLARNEGHVVAMSLDANNFIEPDAIVLMFAKAHKLFVKEQTDTVLLHRRIQRVVKNPSFIFRQAMMAKKGISVDIDAKNSVWGNFMAWNTDWLKAVGGVPETASEDYALGFVARQDGRSIDETENVAVWGYGPSSLKEIQKTRARSVRGGLQLIAFDPSAREEIEEQFYMQNMPARVGRLFQRVMEKPIMTPFHVGNFFLWEHARWMGRRDFKRNPANMSWEPIDSTK